MAKVFKSHFGSDHFYSITYIGPQIGDTLLFNGIVATLIALLTTMVYVMVRFGSIWIKRNASSLHDLSLS